MICVHHLHIPLCVYNGFVARDTHVHFDIYVHNICVLDMSPYCHQVSTRSMQQLFMLQSDANSSDADDVDDDGDLFEPKRRDTGSGADASNPNALDAPDSSRVAIGDSLLSKWGEPGQTEQLRNRFVTGKLLHLPGFEAGLEPEYNSG